MTDKNKPLELVFMPGCFDGFEGSQEELDEMIALIRAKVEDGSIIDEARPIDMDTDEEFLEEIALKLQANIDRQLQ